MPRRHIGKWHLGGAEHGPEKNGFEVNIGGTQAGSPSGGYFNFNTPTLKLKSDEYLTDRLTDEAVRFIDEHPESPFFVYLWHYAVHIPLQAKQEIATRYRGQIKTEAVHTNPLYAAMVESVDESVGRIMERLDELKLAENTIVIVTSDNGGLSVREGPNTPATSNHPFAPVRVTCTKAAFAFPCSSAGLLSRQTKLHMRCAGHQQRSLRNVARHRRRKRQRHARRAESIAIIEPKKGLPIAGALLALSALQQSRRKAIGSHS